MKTTSRRGVDIAWTLAATMFLTGCPTEVIIEDDPPPPPPPIPTIVTIDVAELVLAPEEESLLAAIVLDQNQSPMPDVTVSWVSDEPSIASVSEDGLVTAHTVGEARISATAGDAAAVADVTVREPVVEIRRGLPEVVPMELGESRDLSPGMQLLDRHGTVLDDRTLEWTSDRPEVVSMTDEGFATAVGQGYAIITAAVDGVRSRTRIPVGDGPASLTVDSTWVSLSPGGTVRLVAVPRDEDGDPDPEWAYTWWSDSEEVATVTADGDVTATGPGWTRVYPHSGAKLTGVWVTVVEPDDWAEVHVGNHATCVRGASGTVACWGARSMLGSDFPDDAPRPIQHLSQLAGITLGSGFGCGWDFSGEPACWGRNFAGQLGDGTTVDRRSPAPLVGPTTQISQASAGGEHACAIDSDGAALCWGSNYSGQLGSGSLADFHTEPVVVAGNLTWEALAPGGNHTCGVTTGGDTYCWGGNDEGQVGDGTTEERRTPVHVAGYAFTAVTAGLHHTCALTSAGEAHCWGAGIALGHGGTDSRSEPTAVAGGHTFTQVSAGSEYACGVEASGGLLCWGYNGSGRLGDGTTELRTTPTPVVGGATYSHVSTALQTCAMTTTGAVHCWGYNHVGQVGDGTNENRLEPYEVPLP